MRKFEYTLDPLWIIKGANDFDVEYYNYVLLAANKKFRESLDKEEFSKFDEIMFHCLNLNNLVIEGSMFDSNFKPNWKDPKLIEIRNNLRKIYDLPEDLVEIFKNANYLLTSLLIDYLDKMLDNIEKCKVYFMNPNIHKEKEIFFIINQNRKSKYSIWRLRYDRRYKMGQKLEKLTDVELLPEEDIKNKIKESTVPDLNLMEGKKNTIFLISNKGISQEGIIIAMVSAISFSKRIGLENAFNPNVLDELHEILIDEKVLPFTIKSWV